MWLARQLGSVLWLDGWKPELCSEKKRPLLGYSNLNSRPLISSGSVSTFPRKRICAEQYRNCWRIDTQQQRNYCRLRFFYEVRLDGGERTRGGISGCVWFSETLIINVLKSVAKKRLVKTEDFYVSCDYNDNWSVWFTRTVIITG
jgi:hypothetical protein